MLCLAIGFHEKYFLTFVKHCMRFTKTSILHRVDDVLETSTLYF